MSTKKFKVGKLIRSHLPEIIQKNHIQTYMKQLNQVEYNTELRNKLLEEAREALLAEPGDLLEELADCLEVITALAHLNGANLEAVVETANRKRGEKGGFVPQAYLEGLEVPIDHPNLSYYLSRYEEC